MTDDLFRPSAGLSKHTFLPFCPSVLHLEYSDLGTTMATMTARILSAVLWCCQDVDVAVDVVFVVLLDVYLFRGASILLTHRADDIVNHPLSGCGCLSSSRKSAIE